MQKYSSIPTTSSKMKDFDWVAKILIGIFGTTLSVILENVSVFLSIIAAISTIIFMVYQIKYVQIKRIEMIEQHLFNRIKRKNEKEDDTFNSTKQ